MGPRTPLSANRPTGTAAVSTAPVRGSRPAACATALPTSPAMRGTLVYFQTELKDLFVKTSPTAVAATFAGSFAMFCTEPITLPWLEP